MGEVVQLSEYREPELTRESHSVQDSLVPVEFAVGFADRNQCLNKLAEYGVESLHIRSVTEEPGTLLYLIGVKDAINLNKSILEREAISEDEIASRIDVIQMLENVNLALMESMWESFTRRGNSSHR